MKKLFFTLGIAAVFTACGGNSSKQNAASDESQTKAAIEAMTVDNLMAETETFIDKEVSVKGSVMHVCEHSGKRCFVANDDQSLTIRIEAKGDIGTFDRELIGTEIAATGTFREYRLPEEEIRKMEVGLEEMKAAKNADTEQCEAEAANISQMRKWMKENGKDYYAIYYVDGTDYDVMD